MNLKNSFHPYAAVTIIFWSLTYVLTRLTLQYFSAFSLGLLRYFIASCTLLIVALSTKMKLPRRTDLPWIILSGATGFFLYMIAFNQGQGTVTACTGSVVLATVPVITALRAHATLLGGGIILLGVFTLNFGGKFLELSSNQKSKL